MSLLNDILDLAKVEAGRLRLDPQPFALCGLIGQLGALHGAHARAKGIALTVRCADRPDLCRIGDELRIRQILHNLLGNAVKFTSSGSVALEVCAGDGDAVAFRVTDTGIGMTEDQLARIFEAFEQAEAGTTRRFGGTGLGMAVVRRLVDVMGGRISIDSARGCGTRVEVILNLPAAPAEEPLPARPGTDAPAPVGADPGRLRGLRVLAADDTAANRKLLSLLLQKLGVTCVLAGNGAEALALWRAQSFDVVLLDISMPSMDGVEVLRCMLAEAEAAGAPPPRVLAATANVMPDQIAAYRAAGFVGTLPKPFRRQDLVEALLRARA